jgi:RNA polymerase sigma-70 factor (ECF subfamily)
MGYEKRARREEQELVRRMLAGDAEARDAFADGYFPSLYRFACSRLGGNTELARDIVQTTVCKALGRLSSYRGEAPLFTWLCACCRNEIGMHFRHHRRFPEQALDDEPSPIVATVLDRRDVDSPEGHAARQEAAHRVHAALDLLPPRYARALEWKYLDELPVVEIAERLAVRPKAAESLLTRARGAFRDAFGRLDRERAEARPTPHQPEEGADHGLPARALE